MDDFMKFMLISGNLQRMQEELENEQANMFSSKEDYFNNENEEDLDIDIDSLDDESLCDDSFEINYTNNSNVAHQLF